MDTCACGAVAAYSSTDARGICHDCYKSLDANARRALILRKLRGVAETSRV